VIYRAGAGQVNFPFPFFAWPDMQMYVNGAEVSFTVAGVAVDGEYSGGMATLAVAPGAGA
jgi:hypothetical protein